jgi:hypothetical protein
MTSGGDFEIVERDGNGIRFYTNNLERMRIDSAGDVSIGGSFNSSITLAIGDSDTGIDWNSDGNISLFANNNRIINIIADKNVGIGKDADVTVGLDVESNSGDILIQGYRPTATAGDDLLRLNSDVGGTNINTFLVEANGNTFNTNNAYGMLSDIRYKENIVDCDSQWEDIKKIRFVNYNLKGQETKQLGIIAQEIEIISPSLVETKDNEEKTKYVKSSVMYMKGMKVIQECIEKIEKLEESMMIVKGRLDNIENEINIIKNM